ncbi:MAG: hypothetical protein LBN97_04835 [Oscillospiraceae bacterium]|jgi:hypothetical protein|nr:hypothetical protein [Oscillospiraceae bacterium]
MAVKAKMKSEALARLGALQVDDEFVTNFKNDGLVPLFTQYAYIERFGFEAVEDTSDSERPRLEISDDTSSVVYGGKGWDCYYYGLRRSAKEEEIKAIIAECEAAGNLVYAAHIMDTAIGQMLTLLFVGKIEKEWDDERRNEKSNLIIAAAKVLGSWMQLEYGDAGIFSAAGRLFRFV